MIELRNARLELRYEDKSLIVPDTRRAIAKALHDWGLSTGPQEIGWTVAFSNSKRLHTIIEVARGTSRELPIHMPTLLGSVLTSGADRFFFVHNHPGGVLVASPADIELTQQISDAAGTCGLFFEDHLIVTQDADTLLSLRQRGLYIPPEYHDREVMRAAGYET